MTLSNKALELWFGGEAKMNWRCEDHLKGLLDAFIEQWPQCKPVGPKARRSLEVSARDLYEELGEDPDFITWARERIRRESPHLTIKSLRSLLFLVPDWRSKETEEFDDFWD